MEVYLDNSATTRIDEDALALMEKVYTTDYGNPSSRHKKGVDAEHYIKNARQQIAATLKCKPEEILFTSGGTESNNTAIIGTALANRRKGMHIVTTAFEHASVYQTMFFLEEMGYTVTYLKPEADGSVSCEALKAALRPDTVLVSVMAVNNEVGAVLDVTALGKTVKDYDSSIVFHVDAIQSYGKINIYPGRQNIDLMSVSSHKFHGPKGCGFLYIREKTKIKPIIYGGGQQKGMRSGTENVPGIAGMGLAAEKVCAAMEKNNVHMLEIKRFFASELMQIPEVTIHLVSPKKGEEITDEEFERRLNRLAPHIMSVGFAGVRSEVLLHALEERGIFVSSGSACSSNHPAVSGTLKAIGVAEELLESTVRFSFCESTTKEDLEYTVSVLSELIPMLRKFKRK